MPENLFDRFDLVYDRLIGETENPATLRNERKNHLLSMLLNLCEYLAGKTDVNPVDEWFDPAEPNAVAPNQFAKMEALKSRIEALENSGE